MYREAFNKVTIGEKTSDILKQIKEYIKKKYSVPCNINGRNGTPN